MARVIALASQKGGTGKTTSTVTLGHALSQIGKKVLMVDLDPQGQVSEHFSIVADQLESELSDVLQGTRRLPQIIIPDIRPNLDLAPSNIKLADMELTLVRLTFRETKLRRALEPVLKLYDYVLLDCPPSLGLLTVNALVAATHVLIPMASDYFSMLGVSLLIRTIESIQIEGNPDLKILGIIATHYRKTVHAREVVARTKEELTGKVRVFEPPVHDTTKFKEASAQGKTILDIAGDSQGASAYRQIAQEIIHG